jgi:flagellar hook-basal body complex protein FliE
MSDLDISQVLAQMRVVAARSQGLSAIQSSQETGATQFSAVLKDSINAVNETQKHSGAMSAAFQRGDPGVDLTEVMVAMQKASVSFQAVTQVRNKLVDAYQEIMRMNI